MNKDNINSENSNDNPDKIGNVEPSSQNVGKICQPCFGRNEIFTTFRTTPRLDIRPIAFGHGKYKGRSKRESHIRLRKKFQNEKFSISFLHKIVIVITL